MKASTLVGILFGILAIFGAFIWEGGTLAALIMLPALMIVFGGTLAAALAGSSFEHISKIPKFIFLAISPPRYDVEGIITKIVSLSAVARREGILAIEQHLKNIEQPFLRKLFQICIDGADPETLQKIVTTEIAYITERHNANIDLFIKLGGFSPTMGIIGTVMGLISTLAAAGAEPKVLIHHIASAFIATLWGIFMANIVWLPIGDKLRTLHNEEMQILQVMLDGVYSVQLGETPTVIRTRLISAFPISEQSGVMDRTKNAHLLLTTKLHSRDFNPIIDVEDEKQEEK
jgi:chemotaxis protein MotA